jgi:hypothetical protein
MADRVTVDHAFVEASRARPLLNQNVEIMARETAEQHRGAALMCQGDEIAHIERRVWRDQDTERASPTAFRGTDANAMPTSGRVWNDVAALERNYLTDPGTSRVHGEKSQMRLAVAVFERRFEERNNLWFLKEFHDSPLYFILLMRFRFVNLKM